MCAAKGFWYPFDDEVLRQTNASHSEARVCVTDAEEGASAAAAAAAAEAHAAARREALAKKKEKEKIPSLRDFKSDLEAKVADARDAKKGKKEAEQREKEPREVSELHRRRREASEVSPTARAKREEPTRKIRRVRRVPDKLLADSAESVPTSAGSNSNWSRGRSRRGRRRDETRRDEPRWTRASAVSGDGARASLGEGTYAAAAPSSGRDASARARVARPEADAHGRSEPFGTRRARRRTTG